MKILVTGAAGFIGFHSSKRLLDDGHEVVGIDNLNDYYDVALKMARLSQLEPMRNFSFQKLDLSDRQATADLFAQQAFDVVLHLGAQAGVRYSIDNPFAYLDSNLTGTLTVLEGCRHNGVQHLVYASSSSVYGANTKQPFSISDRVEKPISLYAATKKSNELMCETYSHLYGIKCTGLRFFTVYGPWGRPDMAYFKFAESVLDGRPISVYNNGDMKRDFTHVDDIVSGIHKIIKSDYILESGPAHRIYNLGNNRPEQLGHMIELIEKATGRNAVKNLMPMQPGDVNSTYADISESTRDFGYQPSVTLDEGIPSFVNWLTSYRNSR
ncbi:MAG: NAD-dependent epimerase/dehydratase family protein [Luteimonas sp.]